MIIAYCICFLSGGHRYFYKQFWYKYENGFPVFATQVEANYVAKKQDLFSAYKLTQEDKEEIEKLAKYPRIGKWVCYQDKFVGIIPCYLSMEDFSSYFVYFCRLLKYIAPIYLWSIGH